MSGEDSVKLAGEQWAGAQAEQLDRLERFVCLTVIVRQSEKVFFLAVWKC